MAEPTLYLFDGFNLLHAGGFGRPAELRDVLASFVAMQGARGIVVFDGPAPTSSSARSRCARRAHADTLLERLAAEHRATRASRLVSSDAAVRGTVGRRGAEAVARSRSSRELAPPRARGAAALGACATGSTRRRWPSSSGSAAARYRTSVRIRLGSIAKELVTLRTTLLSSPSTSG